MKISAVIDVGTNAVKLLVAEVNGDLVRPVLENNEQTRLGRGFYESHRLQPDAIRQTAKAVARFASDAKANGAGVIRAIATSAAREAVNVRDLTDAVLELSGLTLEIISGDQEARLAFQGVSSDSTLAKYPLLILDVGGGSTEFILGAGREILLQRSFPIGAVRLMEKFPPNDPPGHRELARCRAWLKDFFEKEILPEFLEPVTARLSQGLHLVGTGGTASILARMEHQMATFDRDRIEAATLSRLQVVAATARLWSQPLADRKKIIGLPPNRADVALFGAAIYASVMEEFGLPELRISTRGLRFAALLS